MHHTQSFYRKSIIFSNDDSTESIDPHALTDNDTEMDSSGATDIQSEFESEFISEYSQRRNSLGSQIKVKSENDDNDSQKTINGDTVNMIYPGNHKSFIQEKIEDIYHEDKLLTSDDPFQQICDDQSQHMDGSLALSLCTVPKHFDVSNVHLERFDHFASNHCVRCHKEFSSNERCELPHPMDEVVLRRRDSNESFYRCLVCGAGIRTQGPYYESIKYGFWFKFDIECIRTLHINILLSII